MTDKPDQKPTKEFEATVQKMLKTPPKPKKSVKSQKKDDEN